MSGKVWLQGGDTGLAWRLVLLINDALDKAAIGPFLVVARAVKPPVMAYLSPERSVRHLARARNQAGLAAVPEANVGFNGYLRSLLETCAFTLPPDGCLWIEAVPEWTPQATFWLRDQGWTDIQVFPLARRIQRDRSTVLMHACGQGRNKHAGGDIGIELTGWDRDRAAREAILACSEEDDVVFSPTLTHFGALTTTILANKRFCLGIEPNPHRAARLMQELRIVIGPEREGFSAETLSAGITAIRSNN